MLEWVAWVTALSMLLTGALIWFLCMVAWKAFHERCEGERMPDGHEIRDAELWMVSAVVRTPAEVENRRQAAALPCDSVRRTCRICWYGPECGPFYGIERVDIDTERRCPCACHAGR